MQSHELSGRYLIRNRETGTWLAMTPKTEQETKAYMANRLEEGTSGKYEVYELQPRRVMVETKIIIC